MINGWQQEAETSRDAEALLGQPNHRPDPRSVQKDRSEVHVHLESGNGNQHRLTSVTALSDWRELGPGLSARRGLNRELSEREAAGLAPRQTEGCRSRKRSKMRKWFADKLGKCRQLDASPKDDVSQRRNRVVESGQTETAATRGRPRRLDARNEPLVIPIIAQVLLHPPFPSLPSFLSLDSQAPLTRRLFFYMQNVISTVAERSSN